MDLYKFSFAVLTAANIGLGVVQYRSRNNNPRSRANSSPRSPRSSVSRKSSYEHDDSSHVHEGFFKNPFTSVTSGDEEKSSGGRLTPTGLADRAAAWSFQKVFFSVYLLVVAADWLQGPYLYTLYKDEKALAERTVAFLFASGFVSAAVSASFVGGLADLHGRKKACLIFCCIYSLSCLSMMSDSVVVLFFGRVLGGVSTTLMYSVFETWMVHEFHARNMSACGLVLGKVFGLMTTMSSVVAILSGVVGEAIVDWTETKRAPFLLAVVCLASAAFLIWTQWVSVLPSSFLYCSVEPLTISHIEREAFASWNILMLTNNSQTENFGGSAATSKEAGTGAGTDIKNIIQDTRIVSLGIISCLFEGSMYLFVFFWSAALKSAHAGSALEIFNVDPSTPPPFGLIFATFMSSMMFGSQLFTITTSSNPASSGGSGGSGYALGLSSHTQYLSMTLLFAALSFLLVSFMGSHPRREEITLWSFCLFEAMVGIYYPSMGYLKGQIVPDGMRAKVYGLLRLPLNVFVVSVLGITQEGDRHRDGVFLSCGGLLIVAYIVAQKYLA